jgi:hypothetical protein
MLATNDGLVRHTSSSSSHTATPTGSTSSSNNGLIYLKYFIRNFFYLFSGALHTPGNRIFQSPLGQVGSNELYSNRHFVLKLFFLGICSIKSGLKSIFITIN